MKLTRFSILVTAFYFNGISPKSPSLKMLTTGIYPKARKPDSVRAQSQVTSNIPQMARGSR